MTVTALALIADIHGNTWALDAVLADIDSLDPAGALERLMAQAIPTVSGNQDRIVHAPPPELVGSPDQTFINPQPGFARPLAPARRIDIDVVGLEHRLLHFRMGREERPTGHLLQMGHAADTDGQQPDHLQQRHQFPMTDAVAPVEQGAQRHHPWPKCTGRDIRRSWRRDEVTTSWAADGQGVLFRDVRLDLGNLPHLLALGQADRTQGCGQQVGWTGTTVSA